MPLKLIEMDIPCSLFRVLRKLGYFKGMATNYFGYQPEIIQIDNGFEFTHFKE